MGQATLPHASADEDFFEDIPPSPYRDEADSYPSLRLFEERYSRRIYRISQPGTYFPPCHNPHTLIDVLQHTGHYFSIDAAWI